MAGHESGSDDPLSFGQGQIISGGMWALSARGFLTAPDDRRQNEPSPGFIRGRMSPEFPCRRERPGRISVPANVIGKLIEGMGVSPRGISWFLQRDMWKRIHLDTKNRTRILGRRSASPVISHPFGRANGNHCEALEGIENRILFPQRYSCRFVLLRLGAMRAPQRLR